jgi:hypothetical protein
MRRRESGQWKQVPCFGVAPRPVKLQGGTDWNGTSSRRVFTEVLSVSRHWSRVTGPEDSALHLTTSNRCTWPQKDDNTNLNLVPDDH